MDEKQRIDELEATCKIHIEMNSELQRRLRRWQILTWSVIILAVTAVETVLLWES